MLKIQLDNYRSIFIAIALIGLLLFSWPTVSVLFKMPHGQQFSEIYFLGPNKNFEGIPSNIQTGVSYQVYLGLGNNLGHSSYYSCLVKISNGSEFMPDTKLGKSIDLPVLYEYKIFIKDGDSIQLPLTFQVDSLTFTDLSCQLSGMRINGLDVPVTETSDWSSDKAGFYYNLIVELWLFNSTLGKSQFNDRFVSLPLNMTQRI